MTRPRHCRTAPHAPAFFSSELACQFGAGGYVGRASGRAFDTRKDLAYPPYDQLHFTMPVLQEGDVNARVWIRIKEIDVSLSLIEQMLDQLPHGDARIPIEPAGPGVAIAVTEAFRGDVLVWLRLDNEGRVDRCHLRDPSWFQWPLLEAAIEGNIVADFPLCNKSFNCSYSGPHSCDAATGPIYCCREILCFRASGRLSSEIGPIAPLGAELNRAAQRRLGRSLAIREVDAGSCNGCELEIHALNNPFYDLERFRAALRCLARATPTC